MLNLIHGDCLQELDKLEITENMCIVTDPPFNIKYHYNLYKDNLKEEEYLNWLKSILDRGIPFVVVHYPEMLHKLSIKLGYAPTKVVSWIYNSNTAKQHRDIAFYNVKPIFSQVGQPYKNPTDKRIKKRILDGKMARLYDWWNINQVKNVSKKNIDHPCVMPQEILNNIIGVLPKEYSTIIDPFMGTGTTGKAAKKYNKAFIGIEIDEKYYNICKVMEVTNMNNMAEKINNQRMEYENEIAEIFLWVQLELFKKRLWCEMKSVLTTSKVSDNKMTITRNYFIVVCREEFPIYKNKEKTLSNILEALNVQ